MAGAENRPPQNEARFSNRAELLLSRGEYAVLDVFREFLMTPGKMLCFDSSDLETYYESLTQLTTKGLLVAEKRRGGYSLTNAGFAAMENGQ